MPQYLPGDIVITKWDNKLISWFTTKCFTPSFNGGHVFLVGEALPDSNDNVIYEAIGSGVRMGRLSWYSHTPYIVLRHKVNMTDNQLAGLGMAACREASDFGRKRYDFYLSVSILWQCLKIWFMDCLCFGRPEPVSSRDLSPNGNARFICSEFVDAVWRLKGLPIVQQDELPLPCSYILAWKENRLVLVGGNRVKECL